MPLKYLQLTVLILIIHSCTRKECDFPGSHVFEIPATLSAALETFRVGDTITIHSTFDDMVYEKQTNKQYKLENWLFYPETIIVRIDDTAAITDNFSEFDVLLENEYDYNLYMYSSGAVSLVGQYLYENNVYDLKYSIVLKKIGVYFFKHAIGLFEYGKGQTFEGQCRHTEVEGAVKLNGSSTNNIHLLSSSPDKHFNTWVLEKPDQRFHRFGGYCFRVVP